MTIHVRCQPSLSRSIGEHLKSLLLPKILIIRFSSIGDIVLTTPVIRCVKEQKSDIEIHYLTKKSFQKWLLVNFKIDRMPAIHVVDRYLKTVEQLGIKNDNKGLDYFIPQQDEINLASLPASHQKKYIGFVIGAKHFTKQLPIEKIISICKKSDQPIILLGGKEDVERANKIEEAIGTSIYNACGKYNLNQSASLIKQAKKIITHDTGLMHIAAAFKKEIISVWGNTVTSFGFSPYLPDSRSKIVEVKNLSCRPCSKIGYDKCPKGHFNCMMMIDEKEII